MRDGLQVNTSGEEPVAAFQNLAAGGNSSLAWAAWAGRPLVRTLVGWTAAGELMFLHAEGDAWAAHHTGGGLTLAEAHARALSHLKLMAEPQFEEQLAGFVERAKRAAAAVRK